MSSFQDGPPGAASIWASGRGEGYGAEKCFQRSEVQPGRFVC